MSKLAEYRNTIIHIVAEVIIIASITVFFVYKHKIISDTVDKLKKQLDEQNIMIKKQHDEIEQLKSIVSIHLTEKLVNPQPIVFPMPHIMSGISNSIFNTKDKTSVDTDEDIRGGGSISNNAVDTFENESDLDEEIENELLDLED